MVYGDIESKVVKPQLLCSERLSGRPGINLNSFVQAPAWHRSMVKVGNILIKSAALFVTMGLVGLGTSFPSSSALLIGNSEIDDLPLA